MKKSGILAASVAAASAGVVSALDYNNYDPNSSEDQDHERKEEEDERRRRSGAGGKFAPRFDGLRFIETLVTAHR